MHSNKSALSVAPAAREKDILETARTQQTIPTYTASSHLRVVLVLCVSVLRPVRTERGLERDTTLHRRAAGYTRSISPLPFYATPPSPLPTPHPCSGH